ncbi:MAG: hypothetical protein AAF231_09745 [Pseudomonadota bacterium]
MVGGLHFSLFEIAAEFGLSFSGITWLTTMCILIFMTSICALLGYIAVFFVEWEVSQVMSRRGS